MRLPRRIKTSMSSGYTPEIDATTELESDGINTYQGIIGELRWAIDIGIVDIGHEVSVLSSYKAVPRDDHLQDILSIFASLKKNPKPKLYLNPSPAVIYPTSFTGSATETFRYQ